MIASKFFWDRGVPWKFDSPPPCALYYITITIMVAGAIMFIKRLQYASRTPPRRFPDGPRYPQDASNTALKSRRHLQMIPGRPRTQDASRPRCCASEPDFSEVFTHKIVDFWIGWVSFLHATSYQITCHVIPEYVKCLFGYAVTLLLARWRVRSSAALWIYIYIY